MPNPNWTASTPSAVSSAGLSLMVTSGPAVRPCLAVRPCVAVPTRVAMRLPVALKVRLPVAGVRSASDVDVCRHPATYSSTHAAANAAPSSDAEPEAGVAAEPGPCPLPVRAAQEGEESEERNEGDATQLAVVHLVRRVAEPVVAPSADPISRRDEKDAGGDAEADEQQGNVALEGELLFLLLPLHRKEDEDCRSYADGHQRGDDPIALGDAPEEFVAVGVGVAVWTKEHVQDDAQQQPDGDQQQVEPPRAIIVPAIVALESGRRPFRPPPSG